MRRKSVADVCPMLVAGTSRGGSGSLSDQRTAVGLLSDRSGCASVLGKFERSAHGGRTAERPIGCASVLVNQSKEA